MKVLVIALVILLAALQYRVWFGDGSVQELWRLRNEVQTQRAEISRLTVRNQALAAEVTDLKNGDDAIEERARANLGMIGKGEVFYQFIGEKKRNANGVLNAPSEDSVNPLPKTQPGDTL